MARTTRLSSLRRRSGGASSHGISNATLGNDSSSVQSGSQGSSSFSTRQKQNGGSSTDDSTVIIAVVAVAIMVGIICFALWGRRMMRRNRQQRLLRQARLASLDSKPEMWDISLDSATLRDREGLEWRNITPIAVNVFGDTHQIERIYNLFSSTPAKPQWEPQPLHERTVGRIPNESHKIVKDEDICVRIMVAIAMPSCRRRKSGTDGEPLELCLGIAEARWNERDRESSLN